MPPEKSRAHTNSFRFALLLVLMSMVGPIATHMIVPAVPGLVVLFKTDPGTAQLTVSLFLLGLAVSQLCMGPLADRFGRRPIILAGMMLTALASIGAIIASGIGWLILMRCLQSLGASAGLVLGRAIIRDLYGRDRAASMMAWVTMPTAVAPMLSPFFGGLLDTAFGWQSIFVVIMAVSCGAALWVFFSLPETRPERVESVDMAVVVSDAVALLKNRSFMAYAAMATFATANHFAFLGAAPYLLVNIMGLSSAAYGTWFIIVPSGYIIGNFVTARLSTRFGVNRMIFAGVLTMWSASALATALLLSFPDGGLPVLFGPQFIMAFSAGLIQPNAIAGGISVRPEAAGTASGVIGFLQLGSGAFITQLLSYVVSHASDARPVSFTMLAIATIGLIIFFLWFRPYNR